MSKQQKPNGTWAFDGQKSADVPSATGMALLPYLAAGCSHKPGTSNSAYNKTVMQGLKALIASQNTDGSFNRSGDQYSHAIATLALVEAYGLTQDRALLHVSAQKAIDRLQQSQATDGSWGYSPHSAGDTSITGWQIQAIYAAKLTKVLKVDQKVLDKANAFLDTVAEGKAKEKYGYRSPTGTPNMTAVGLLARVQSGAWTPENPGYVEGVKYLLANAVPQKELRDSYFVYYATQVLFRHGGEAWAKQWNPQVRDLLVSTQQTNDTGGLAGSWDRDQAIIGTNCGRLGTTALALLSLEVYYRYPQSEKPIEPAK